MNEGMISKRYARALLQSAIEQKVEDQVYAEMKRLNRVFQELPTLRSAMNNPTLSNKDKEGLILAAIDENQKVCELTKSFVNLVTMKKRNRYIQFMALSYIDLYCDYKNILTAQLTTATDVNDEVITKIKALAQKITSGQIDFDTNIDPSIEGGFILKVDTYRLDASVRSQLNKIRKDLIYENTKLA